MKVTPEVEAKFDSLRAERDQLRRRVAMLERENEELANELNESPAARSNGRPVQTVQATSKLWKLLMVAGACMLLGSCVAGLNGAANENSNSVAGAVLLFVFGGATYFAGRFGKFWFHE
ncbi:MAG: hypothetical protein Fues2KO_24160 [Fuerstiella sp.]